MKSYFFSIIIPTLNEEKYLPKLLKDLAKQSYKNFETIVVDGQSEDKTVELTEKFKNNLNLKIIISKKKSVAFQRNLGAKKGKGSYLVFLDADSRVDKSFLKKINFHINSTKALILTPHILIGKSSVINKTIGSISNNLIYISNYMGRPFYPGACLIFQKDFFIHIGGFKLSKKQAKKKLFPEDVDLMIRSRKAGVNSLYLKNVSFRYSMRRFHREGYLPVIAKYIASAMEIILKGKSASDIDYQMGGNYYLSKKNKKVTNQLVRYLNKIKKSMEDILEDIKD